MDYTNPKTTDFKNEFAKLIGEQATPTDDPTCLELQTYCGAILYANETRASLKLFRVVAIQFVRSFNSNRPSCWEATCEPIYRDSGSGIRKNTKLTVLKYYWQMLYKAMCSPSMLAAWTRNQCNYPGLQITLPTSRM